MSISQTVREALAGASWIRRMFEEGLKLKEKHGADQVADLALGNPVVEPPPAVVARLRELADDPEPGTHRYMPNAGLSETRHAVAQHLRRETGELYGDQHIVMTTGAGGALVVLLKSILDPGDEVIVLAPFFVEYVHYVANFGAKTVVVQTDDGFRPDPSAIADAITARTRAIITNSPNNPTGVVYDSSDLAALATVLERESARHGRPIYWISDEPYRALAYDGVEVPWPIHHYAHLLHVTSFSKDLALPGERIGYVALPPPAGGNEELFAALVFSMRALGFVNAPALQQRLVAGLLEEPVDVRTYASHRRRILDALDGAGYEVVRPHGAFYVFPRVPGGEDDVAFVRRCLEERLLVVPGSGFGRPGYFRLSYAVTERTVDLAVAALARVAEAAPGAAGRPAVPGPSSAVP